MLVKTCSHIFPAALWTHNTDKSISNKMNPALQLCKASTSCTLPGFFEKGPIKKLVGKKEQVMSLKNGNKDPGAEVIWIVPPVDGEF